MSEHAGKQSRTASGSELRATAGVVPGKHTQVELLSGGQVSAAVQRSASTSTGPAASQAIPEGVRPTVQDLFGGHLQLRTTGDAAGAPDATAIHATAQRGIATSPSPLPHGETLQRLFGHHDVSAVQAHTGADAAASAQAMGAQAYATGNHVVLGSGADLHTVAHEAAHVVQQRGGVQLKGGVGEAGDVYERHADAVADAVVQGKSAQGLLDQTASPGGHAAPAGAAVQHVLRVGNETKKAGLTTTTKRTLLRIPGTSPAVVDLLDAWARDAVDTRGRRFNDWPAAIAAATSRLAAAPQSTASTGASATAVGAPAPATATPAHDATPAPHDATPAPHDATPAPHDDAGPGAEHGESTANPSVHAEPTTSGPQEGDDGAARDALTALHHPQLPFPGLLFFTHETTPDKVLAQLRGGGMKSRATLVADGTLPPNQDTRKGGGYYVYTRMVGNNSELKLGQGSKGSAGRIMVILSPELATRNDWFTAGLDLMGRVPPSIMPTTRSGFPPSWTLINRGEAFQPNGKGQMTSTFGMPPDTLHRAVTDQLRNPSGTNEQGFFGSIPLSNYEQIIVKRDRAPTTAAGTGPSDSSGGSGITSAAMLIAKIREDPAQEAEILRATRKARLEDLIVDKTKGQLVTGVWTRGRLVPAPSPQVGASSSSLADAPAAPHGDPSPPPEDSDAT